MFSPPSMWLPDAFRHFQTTPIPPTPFPSRKSATMDPYSDTPMYKPSRRCDKGKYNPLSHFNSDISETDLDTDTDLPYPSRIPDFEHISRTSLRLPKFTARSLHPDQILILPPTLTSLKISLHTHTPQRTIRAAVAGDMRLRDVIKQILPQEHLYNARVYVKNRGEWVEPGSPMKLSDVVELERFARNEIEEVEVRIVVGSGREKEGRKGYRWEKEVGIGRMERMWVY